MSVILPQIKIIYQVNISQITTREISHKVLLFDLSDLKHSKVKISINPAYHVTLNFYYRINITVP